MSNFDDVGKFHKKFGLHHSPLTGQIADNKRKKPLDLDSRTIAFRLAFLEEELQELKTAYDANDTAGIADALVDLVYVAMGTAHLHNLPWQDLWEEVQRSNMEKERAQSSVQSKRGSALDVIKPEGWQPPDIKSILRQYD